MNDWNFMLTNRGCNIWENLCSQRAPQRAPQRDVIRGTRDYGMCDVNQASQCEHQATSSRSRVFP